MLDIRIAVRGTMTVMQTQQGVASDLMSLQDAIPPIAVP